MAIPDEGPSVIRRHLQTNFLGPGMDGFGPGNVGNCSQAVLASILDVPMGDVPNLADYPPGYEKDDDPLVDEHGGLWYRSTRRWLRARWQRDFIGYDPETLPEMVAIYAADPDCWPRHMLGGVDSPRGDFKHIVVLDETGTIVWDPHPDQDGYGLPLIDLQVICGPYDPPPPEDDPWAAIHDEHVGVVREVPA